MRWNIRLIMMTGSVRAGRPQLASVLGSTGSSDGIVAEQRGRASLSAPTARCRRPGQMLVLEVISELCRDPLALVEMFVNYDCDLQAIDLFKRIVTALAKVEWGLCVGTASRRPSELVRPPIHGRGCRGIS